MNEEGILFTKNCIPWVEAIPITDALKLKVAEFTVIPDAVGFSRTMEGITQLLLVTDHVFESDPHWFVAERTNVFTPFWRFTLVDNKLFE